VSADGDLVAWRQEFDHAAGLYRAGGWPGQVPIPPGAKKPALTGVTGYDGIDMSWPDLMARLDEDRHRFAQLALRMPVGVVAIDTDGYGGKRGLQTLAEAERRWGPLPTGPWSSSREDGSRIQPFRVPVGTHLAGVISFPELELADIEIIQRHHRTAIVWPSLHSKTGRQYRWHDLPAGRVVPAVADLPELPALWVEGLSRPPGSAGRRASRPEVAGFLDGLPAGECPYVARIAAEVGGLARGSRYQTALSLTQRLVRAGEQGHRGSGQAIDELRRRYVEAVGAERDASGEFDRQLDGAVGRVLDDPTPERDRGCCGIGGWDPLAALIADHEASTQADGTADEPGAAQDTEQEQVVKEQPSAQQAAAPAPRKLRVTKASQVKIRRQRWLWRDRIVLGGLTLLGGREGLGKSTIAADLVAQVTTGRLDGEFRGEPRACVYLHTEDARDTTIVPRLVAAGADLDRVVFVDAVTADEHGEIESQPVFPSDVAAMAELAIEEGAALVVLDAATSVIDGRLDGDKDRQMRRGLEAIARGIGERANCAVLGIVHFGKRESGDTGRLILGSIAWSQVARSVLAVARDEEEGSLVISATKANLAPGDTPSLSARVASKSVITEDGITSIGRIEWLGETDRHARDLLAAPPEEDRTERATAEAWLEDFLTAEGKALSKDIKAAARKADIAERTLQRARKALGVVSINEGFPRQSYWALPEPSDRSGATSQVRARGSGTTGTTGPDQQLYDDADGTTEPVVPTPTHGTTGGATAPVDRPTDTWRATGEPVINARRTA
jgi:hypothetical protein